jgi:hypothetical protein
MVGPVAREDVDTMLRSLADEGFSETWQLSSEDVTAGTDGTAARVRTKSSVRPGTGVSRREQEEPREPGFNFATLCNPRDEESDNACGSRE